MIELKIKIDDNGEATCETTSGNIQMKDLVKIYFTLQSLGNEVKEAFVNEAKKDNVCREKAEKAFNELLTNFYYRNIE